MAIKGSSACCPEGQHRFGNSEVKGSGDFDVGGASIQHLHRPAEAFKQRGIVGDLPLVRLRFCMAATQLVHKKSLGGLGPIVLVRHPDEILTVYGRIDNVTVKKGDLVRSGQKIGVVSNATAPAEPRMHFEVRRGAESLDPSQFL